MTVFMQQGLVACCAVLLVFQLVLLDWSGGQIRTLSYGDVSSAYEHVPTAKKPPHTTASALMTDAQSLVADSEYDSVVFVGDVLLARHVEYLMKIHGSTYPFAGYTFTDATPHPAVVVNFESAVPRTHVPTPALQLRFSTPVQALQSLKAAGVTHASLANNHAYDFGATDFTHTVQRLQQVGVEPFGTPRGLASTSVAYLAVEQATVAVIALQALDGHTSTREQLAQTLAQAAEQSELQVVFIHWGNEYEEVSSRFQREYATMLVELGVDLIIGHHPHVVQEIGLIDGVPVLYSLGNYVFDQYFSVAVQTGLVAQLLLGTEPGVYLLPVSSIDTLSQPAPLTPLAHAAFLHDLADRSAPELRDSIKRGFIPLRMVATSSKIAMIDR